MFVTIKKEFQNHYGQTKVYKFFEVIGQKRNTYILSPGRFEARKSDCSIIKNFTVEMGNKFAGVVKETFDRR